MPQKRIFQAKIGLAVFAVNKFLEPNGCDLATPDKKPIDRRRFFRAALGEMFKPLSKAVAPIERAAQQLGELKGLEAIAPKPPPKGAVPRRQPLTISTAPRLRPPGALPEEQFVSTCSRCGDCVQVCPVRAIKIEPGGRGGGFPFIDPDESPCVLCDGLHCMHHCPSGALVPTLLADIDMGTAKFREVDCLRSASQDCSICVDKCPVGSTALELRYGGITVNEQGCTGCGVCEHYCPTKPKAIVVVPRADATESA